jgi:hypothetical protein
MDYLSCALDVDVLVLLTLLPRHDTIVVAIDVAPLDLMLS